MSIHPSPDLHQDRRSRQSHSVALGFVIAVAVLLVILVWGWIALLIIVFYSYWSQSPAFLFPIALVLQR